MIAIIIIIILWNFNRRPLINRRASERRKQKNAKECIEPNSTNESKNIFYFLLTDCCIGNALAFDAHANLFTGRRGKKQQKMIFNYFETTLCHTLAKQERSKIQMRKFLILFFFSSLYFNETKSTRRNNNFLLQLFEALHTSGPQQQQ